MTLFFIILAAVAAIATIVFYILDEKTGLVCDILAHSFFISTILLLFFSKNKILLLKFFLKILDRKELNEL